MEQTNKIDSFQSFMEWSNALPVGYRWGYQQSSDYLVIPGALSNFFGHKAPTSTYAAAHAVHGVARTTVMNGAQYILQAKTRWWVAREMTRFCLPDGHKDAYFHFPRELHNEIFGSYALPFNPFHFVRINKNDSSAVDFTFTPEDGLRDKVTTMSFGRYLAKFHPWFVPDHVKTLESKLRSMVSDEFDVFMGGENIIKYYNNGPSSCMAFTPNHFGRIENHVLMTYDAPGWGIAIIPQDEQKTRASARSLVWINPDNENDKHYIRVYGDSTLERRLIKAGFKNKIPTRAPLKYVPDRNAPRTHILLPYFDSSRNNSGGDGGYVFMDHDRPYLVDIAEHAKLSKSPIFSRHLIRHNHTTLSTADVRFRGARCVHCGTNDMSIGREIVFNGLVCTPCFKEQDYIMCRDGGSYVYRPRHQTSKVHGADVYINAQTVASMNLVQLDPLYYGNLSWTIKTIGMVKGRKNFFWMRKDTAAVLYENPERPGRIETTYYNMLDNAWDPPKSWKRLFYRQAGETLYADKTLSKDVMQSENGKNVIPGIHTGFAPVAGDENKIVSTRAAAVFREVYGTQRALMRHSAYDEMLAVTTKLTPLEVRMAVSRLGNSNNFAEAAQKQLSNYTCMLPYKPHKNFRGHELLLSSPSSVSHEVLEDIFKHLLDRPIDELFFSYFQTVNGRDLNDIERNAVIGTRTIWLQIREEWQRQKEAKTAELERALQTV